jgi:anthranilate phosphoribosyltransferase
METKFNVNSALRAVTSGETLSTEHSEATMGDIMDGTASALQVAALIGALRMRGETIEEIAGFARAMRQRSVKVPATSERLVDTCGTGGDSPKHGHSTFNVSTAAAFIASGAGATVAKHGNRAMSSQCGSADVLEALGVNLSIGPERIAAAIDQIGIGFMFAQAHHPAMKNVAPIRKELGIRTIFNLLGPLTNPAGAHSQVMGVSDARWLRPIAEVLHLLGTQHAIVAHSDDGLDEFSTCAPTHYVEVKDGHFTEGTVAPHELGCACAMPGLLKGGDAQDNARIIRELLQTGTGPTADLACLNAAAVLIAAGVAQDFAEGLERARAAIRSGKAKQKLEQLVEFTNSTE